MKEVRPSVRYAMDGHTAIRHVVTVLGGAKAPLTAEEMARSYKHPQITDLPRVVKAERLRDEDAAKVWLVERALTRLGPNQIEEVGENRYRLKVRPEDVRIDGQPVAPEVEEKPQFAGGSQPFNPLSETGVLSDNIRAKSESDDLTELRESMKELGWVGAFPAILDERDVVLVGHRRLKVAQELGIDPHIVTLTLGSGKEADAKRARLAIASNIGFRPLTPASRKRLAEYFYGEREWSMQRIAQALGVSKKTISQDLKFWHVTLGNTPDHSDRLDMLGRPAVPTGTALARLLGTFAGYPAGLTDQEISIIADRSIANISLQRKSLELYGLISKADEKRKSPGSTYKCSVWRINEAGKARLERLAEEPLGGVLRSRNRRSPPPAEHVCTCKYCGTMMGGGEP